VAELRASGTKAEFIRADVSHRKTTSRLWSTASCKSSDDSMSLSTTRHRQLRSAGHPDPRDVQHRLRHQRSRAIFLPEARAAHNDRTGLAASSTSPPHLASG